MSTSLVTIEEAKAHLQMDHDDDDADIMSKAEQATDIIIDYLKLPGIPSDWLNETGTPTGGETGSVMETPPRVKAAVLLVLGELYNKREAAEIDLISLGVESLLRRSRDPAMA